MRIVALDCRDEEWDSQCPLSFSEDKPLEFQDTKIIVPEKMVIKFYLIAQVAFNVVLSPL